MSDTAPTGSHRAWIASVQEKLRVALVYAAHGEPFEWDQLGPDAWPDPAPETYEIWPPAGITWPGPAYPGWPDRPSPDASYDQIKRYVNIQVIAGCFMQYDEDFDVPDELRLSPEEAWALAEKGYNDRIGAPDVQPEETMEP